MRSIHIVSLTKFLRLAAHIQLLPVLESGEETLVGGQAVIEGVMMRAPHSYCVAVRKANGEIVTQEMPVPRMSEKYPLLKYPIHEAWARSARRCLWESKPCGFRRTRL